MSLERRGRRERAFADELDLLRLELQHRKNKVPVLAVPTGLAQSLLDQNWLVVWLVEAEIAGAGEDAARGVDDPILGVQRQVQMRRKRRIGVEALVAAAAKQRELVYRKLLRAGFELAPRPRRAMCGPDQRPAARGAGRGELELGAPGPALQVQGQIGVADRAAESAVVDDEPPMRDADMVDPADDALGIGRKSKSPRTAAPANCRSLGSGPISAGAGLAAAGPITTASLEFVAGRNRRASRRAA